MKCAYNLLLPLGRSCIRNLNQWKTFDLDHILCEGDMNYKRFNTFSLLSLDDLSRAVHTADG